MMEHNINSCQNYERKLTDIFDESLEIYESILKSEMPSSNTKLQMEIKHCINLLENCTNLINAAGVFSSNETLDEIPTENLKYLLIPALLGSLVIRVNATERLNALEAAEVYFKDFLRRVQDYEVVKSLKTKDLEQIEAPAEPKKLNLEQLAKQRNEKIKKYMEQKETEAELARLKSLMTANDDEISRNYYITYIRSFVNVSLDELRSIQQEKPLAKHLAESRDTGTYNEHEAKRDNVNSRPFKPIIITRNEMQKKVFGAGYPSLPTMTVEEFYKERVAEGIFPESCTGTGTYMQRLADTEAAKKDEEAEEMRKEEEIEKDNPEYLRKTRNMDEYKDTHKRGWGNRMNRS